MSDSESMTDPNMTDPKENLTAEEVIEFLRGNPAFLQQHPEACDFLIPPKNGAGKNIADFQSFMIKRLKDDKEKVLSTTQEIVANARNNMNNQQRIHNAVLRLLEAADFNGFVQTITMDLAAILDTDIAVLVVESNGRDIPHIHTAGIRVLPAGTIDNWMQDKDILLQSDIGGIDAIYGGGHTLVRSQALLRVDIACGTPPAVLAFGSRDPDTFQDGQATDQVQFLAGVVERCFRRWLDLPA